MRTPVLYCLALLTMASVVSSRYTTSLSENYSDQDIATQLDAGPRRARESPESPTAGAVEAATSDVVGTRSRRDAAEEREKQRLQMLIENVHERMQRAPSLQGEKLCVMVYAGRYEDVRQLLDSNVDVNYTNIRGYTPLHLAFSLPTSKSNPDIVSLLLARGADVHAVDSLGWTPLHFATLWPNEPYVRMLIDAGADVNARTSTGFTPLHVAAQANNKAAVRELLAAGANKNVHRWEYRHVCDTPFLCAISDDLKNLLRP